MSHPVTVLDSVEKVGTIVDILKQESFNGFPVVDNTIPSQQVSLITDYYPPLIWNSQALWFMFTQVIPSDMVQFLPHQSFGLLPLYLMTFSLIIQILKANILFKIYNVMLSKFLRCMYWGLSYQGELLLVYVALRQTLYQHSRGSVFVTQTDTIPSQQGVSLCNSETDTILSQ